MEEKDKEQKKYHVVDKRMALDDDEPAKDAPAAESAATVGSDAKVEHPRHDDSQSEKGGEAAPGELKMTDAMRMSLSMIRERVFLSLGLVISKHRPKEKSLQDAENLSNLFGALADGFGDKLGGDELGDTGGGHIPAVGELLEFLFTMLQGQVVMRLGLMADPTTGLLAKDLEQARQGIDFCAAILSSASGMLSPEQLRRFEAVVSDLRINYVGAAKRN